MRINRRSIECMDPLNVSFVPSPYDDYTMNETIGIYDDFLQWNNPSWLGLKAGEDLKTLTSVQTILQYLVNYKTRPIYVMGGGTIQDAVGFACAIYKRGTPWIFYPTTLLAMADSCIGDKVGLNYDNAKNQLGLFTGPQEVRIDVRFLTTLPRKWYDSGMGEIIKLTLLADDVPCAGIDNHIKKALEIKASIVAIDPYDKNERRVLNLGHTLGHAFEAMANYQIPHGICIAYGTYLMNIYSHQMGSFTRDFDLWQNRLKSVFQNYPFHFAMDNLADYVAKDKKAMGDQITLAVMEEPGESLLITENIADFCRDIQQIISNEKIFVLKRP